MSRVRNRRVKVSPRSSDEPRRRVDLRAAARLCARGARLVAYAVVTSVILAGAGLGGFYGYRYLTASTHFDVERIVFVGVRRAPAEELQQMVVPLKGQSIFRVECDKVAKTVASHPWVAQASAQRDLPRTIRIEVVERQPRAAVLLEHLYLVDDTGRPFKRATVEEAAGLPVISGLSRETWLEDAAGSRAQVARALAAIHKYYENVRPPLSEVNIGAQRELTLFLRQGGVTLRFGDQIDDKRLRRLDAVWAALGADRQRVRAIYLDHTTRDDRVVARLAER